MVIGANNLGFALLVIKHFETLLTVQRVEQVPDLLLRLGMLVKLLGLDQLLLVVVLGSLVVLVGGEGLLKMGLDAV